MDSLVGDHLDSANGSNYNHRFTSSSSSSSSMIGHFCRYEVRSGLSTEPSDLSNESSACAGDDSTPLERDYFDGVLKYINQMLMEEEDLENRPCMLQDSLALQAAEKSFYDALTNDSRDCNFSERSIRGKRDGDDAIEGRASKQFAGSMAEMEQTEVYDKTLLCSANNPGFYSDRPWCHIDHSMEQKLRFKPVNVPSNESKRGRPRASEKRVSSGKSVDLRSLLLQCAEAAANYDIRTASERLRLIRQHSSPYGDAAERLAHYFANSLEARLAGTGTELYTAFSRRRMSAAEMLKAYQVYVTACPFKKMSNIFANKSIGKLTRNSTAIHIIDFGILYGFQWPCFIQGISLRPSGPPKLRITGIDFPQPGFRPAERVEETGRRLANYCKRFNVPFEYNAIAKRWENIGVDELKIDRDETLIVNCLYRLKNTPDETVLENSPRDAVLNLIKQVNPDYFIHGVINGTYNSSFFVTRFKEALFHFSSLFDMYDATVLREDQERLVYEKIFGRDIMNIVACEGNERVERPESYKQWQLRNQRAGLKQIALNQDVIKEVRTKVRLRYHKDFLVDEDSNWMLQGWKGRVLYALSCWTPVEKQVTEL